MTDPVPSKDQLIAKAEQLELYEHKKWYVNPQEYSWLAAQLRQLSRLKTALRGIQSCSTCEACRGAAALALGGAAPEPPAVAMPADVFEFLSLVRNSSVIDLPMRYTARNLQDKYGVAAQPPGDG